MKWWPACCLLLAATQALAADGNGTFSIEGAGALTCRSFLNERDLKSNLYYMIGGWLDGYVTSYNEHVADTYDITTFESAELLSDVIYNHCKDHLDDRLYSVVNSICVKLAPDRLKSKSPAVAIRVGERQGTLYEDVVQRLQRELERRGLLAKASGTFDDQTIDAVKRFQASIKFDPTGYPDQATLWRLLRKE